MLPSVVIANEEAVLAALKSVKYPGYSRDIVSFGLVKNAAVNNGAASVTLELSSANQEVARQLKAECESALKNVPGLTLAHVEVKMPPSTPSQANAPANPMPIPVNASVSPSRTTGMSTCCGDAPSATRIPISRVRSVTV